MAHESPAATQRTRRYEDLTAAEQAGMEWFIQQWGENEQHKAIEGNLMALDLEHLISTLPIDPGQVDDEMRAEVTELRERFHALTGVKVQLHLLGDR